MVPETQSGWDEEEEGRDDGRGGADLLHFRSINHSGIYFGYFLNEALESWTTKAPI